MNHISPAVILDISLAFEEFHYNVGQSEELEYLKICILVFYEIMLVYKFMEIKNHGDILIQGDI